MFTLTASNKTHITSFGQWLLVNRLYILVYILIILIQFSWFKWLYPFPSFFPDSNSYLEAAYYKQAINMWPMGYSWFLRILGLLAHQDTTLVSIQYLLLQAALLYFFSSIIYIFNTGKYVTIVLLLFGLANPLLLHLANFISSDALFTTLSIIWLTQLCWMLYKPGIILLFLHAFILLMVFAVRYNALYYPVISIGIIAISHLKMRIRIAGIVTVVFFIGIFITYTMFQYRQQTGYWQFSSVGGWQMAANALLAYSYVPTLKSEGVPVRFRKLHEFSNQHNEGLSKVEIRPDRYSNIYYLWDYSSPLMQYFFTQGQNFKTSNEYFRLWAKQSPLYGAYGFYLATHYPMAYTRYYVWPNLIRYYKPDTEFLGIYNTGTEVLEEMAPKWFKYRSNKIYTRTSDKQVRFIFIYPYFQAGVNLLFVLGFAGFFLLAGFKCLKPELRPVLWLVIVIWCFNLIFSVLASPVVLRYQVFSMLISFTFGLIWFAFVIKESFAPTPKSDDSKISGLSGEKLSVT